MPAQRFKSVYYADFPAPESRRRKLTLAFSSRDRETFERIGALSSYEIRSLLGYHSYDGLRAAARREGLPVNTYCLRILRQWSTARDAEQDQTTLPVLDNVR
ncbi:MAG: hypothetical protein ACREKI_08580, partial [Gemmatimonadota bacterium]